MEEIRYLENRHDVIFSAEGGPIWIKFRRLVQNDMSTAVIWSKSPKLPPYWNSFVWPNSMACRPEATSRIAGCCHLANSMSWSQNYVSHCRVLSPGEFNDMSSQSQVLRCRMLPLAEFIVMIPEPHATLQGAATWRIQWHVIPEPRVTLQGKPTASWWIHCHDPRATYHIAGCCHLAKSTSWSCHIAWCKNFIRHTKNRFSPYFIIFFVFLMQFGLCLRYTCLYNYIIREA